MNNDYEQLQQLSGGRTIQPTGELARLEKKVIEQAETIMRLTQENERLKAALKPFAEAADEIPEGLRSCLWYWNGNIDEGDGRSMLRKATTDDMLKARDALQVNGSALSAEEVQRNKERRGERMNAIVAATAAGRVKPSEDEISHENPNFDTKA